MVKEALISSLNASISQKVEAAHVLSQAIKINRESRGVTGVKFYGDSEGLLAEVFFKPVEPTPEINSLPHNEFMRVMGGSFSELIKNVDFKLGRSLDIVMVGNPYPEQFDGKDFINGKVAQWPV